MVLKNGLLMEMLLRFSFLCISGSSVLRSIISIVVISKILLLSRNVLCD